MVSNAAISGPPKARSKSHPLLNSRGIEGELTVSIDASDFPLVFLVNGIPFNAVVPNPTFFIQGMKLILELFNFFLNPETFLFFSFFLSFFFIPTFFFSFLLYLPLKPMTFSLYWRMIVREILGS